MHTTEQGNHSKQLKEILFHDLAQLGMTVETFAENINVSYVTVRTWLSRGRIPQRNYSRVIRVLGKDSSFAKSINPDNRMQDAIEQAITLAKRLQDALQQVITLAERLQESEARVHQLEGLLLAQEQQVDPLLH